MGESAYEVFVTSKEILRSGLFNLWKFTTNSPSLQRMIDNAESSRSSSHEKHLCNDTDETYVKSTIKHDYHLNPGGQEILGVYWDVPSDQFLFDFED